MSNRLFLYFFRCLLSAVFCVIIPLTGYAEVPKHDIRLFHDEAFTEEQETFFPFDTIYTVIDFYDMQPGEYTIHIDWIQPNGKLVRNSSHSFALEEHTESYRVFFWLKLHAKGPLGQFISGDEYKPHVFGKWKVQVSCNGEELKMTSFVVSDDVM